MIGIILFFLLIFNNEYNIFVFKYFKMNVFLFVLYWFFKLIDLKWICIIILLMDIYVVMFICWNCF